MPRPRRLILLSWVLALVGAAVSCGPVALPADSYQSAPELLADLDAARRRIESFRIAGRVDHFGDEARISGKVFLFAALPDRLRVELVSPFMSPLSVLTIRDERFALHDLREAEYFEGPAEPCSIARMVHLPLPPEDVIRILIGHTPLIEGASQVTWNEAGHYDVELRDGTLVQRLRVGPDRESLPLLASELRDAEGVVFDIEYSRWSRAGAAWIPHEIEIRMPREKTNLLLRYDEDGVETNVALPEGAFTQSPPPGLSVEKVECR